MQLRQLAFDPPVKRRQISVVGKNSRVQEGIFTVEGSLAPAVGRPSFDARRLDWGRRPSGKRRTLIWRWLLFFVLFFVAGGCRRAETPSEPEGSSPTRVLLIGLDGFEWEIALPMVREGKLPNLAALMHRGVFGRLKTLQPTLSPIIWTSIATGVLPQTHGIYGFVRQERDEQGKQRLLTSQDRRAKAFWNILSDHGRRVITVGWWMTFPVEPVNGVMVAQVNTSAMRGGKGGRGTWKGGLVEGLQGQVFPPEREAEVLQTAARVEKRLPELLREIFGSVKPLPDEGTRQLWENSLWAFRADAIYREIGKRLLQNGSDFDLFAIYFGGADVLGHRFWRFTRPELYRDEPSEREARELGRLIPAYYGYLDGVIGELVEAAPDQSTVIVLSDHGMEPIYTGRRFSGGDGTYPINSGGHLGSPPAFFVAAGPGIGRASLEEAPVEVSPGSLPVLGSVLDVLPTLLALIAVPVGRDMVGEVMTGVVDPVFLADHPVRFVESHTTHSWLQSREASEAETAGSVERLEQLRALGYIE